MSKFNKIQNGVYRNNQHGVELIVKYIDKKGWCCQVNGEILDVKLYGQKWRAIKHLTDMYVTKDIVDSNTKKKQGVLTHRDSLKLNGKEYRILIMIEAGDKDLEKLRDLSAFGSSVVELAIDVLLEKKLIKITNKKEGKKITKIYSKI